MSPSPPPSRALGRAGLQRSGWTVTEKRGNQSSNRFVFPDLPFVTLEASQSGDALVRQTRCQTQVSPLSILPPPGWRPAPCPEAGPGLAGARAAGGSRWRGSPAARRTRSLQPPPACCRSARLAVCAGVFWATDAFGPGFPLVALISSAAPSTPSLGHSACLSGAGMLAFLLAGCASHVPSPRSIFPSCVPASLGL